jgi:hypothetical protein
LAAEVFVEVLDHVRRRCVDVGDGLCRHYEPARPGFGRNELPNLLTKGASVGKERGAVEPEHDEAFDPFGIWIGAHIVIAELPRRAAVACCTATMIGGRR